MKISFIFVCKVLVAGVEHDCFNAYLFVDDPTPNCVSTLYNGIANLLRNMTARYRYNYTCIYVYLNVLESL